MNSFFSKSKWIALAVVCILSARTLWAEVNPKPFVVPELKTWTGAEGRTALSGKIVVKSAKLRGVAQSFATDYKEMFGRELTVTTEKANVGDIVFELKKDKKHGGKNQALGNEGYRLEIGQTVNVTSATAQGAFWATRTLLQLTEQQADCSLPRGITTDFPEYRLRGFMIDCGRKFFTIDYLRNLTKVMAYYKMNTLQIHLNDNGFRQFFDNNWNKTQAAFRLECDTYPGLTAKDGSYTKKEFIDLQKLAESNCVEIIPEIDVPAHSLAFTQYKPEIGSKEYGMDHLDLFNPETYKFVDGLFKEYLSGKEPVFRGKRVHIGTDEYSNAKKDVVEKFREFTDHYIRYVEGFGKQAMVWGALTHAKGDTPVKSENVVMNCWYNGYANPKDMKELGYKLVSIPDGLVYLVPAAGYYYDYLNCEYLYNNWTPATIGNQTFDENDPAIEGGMFAVWNDHVGNGISTKDVHHRVFPALQTLAVKCWTGKKTSLPYGEFDKKRKDLSEAPGVNELGRIGKTGDVVLEMDVLKAGERLNAEEIGYDYSVSFNIEGKAEEKGTVLLKSKNAIVYLADPKEGKLGFEREGYLNTFNYRVEEGKKVNLTIEGDHRMTRLLVDGKLREQLDAKPLYVIREKDRAHYQVENASPYEPVVFQPTEKLNYQRTLVFPLRSAGNFNSTITALKVTAK